MKDFIVGLVIFCLVVAPAGVLLVGLAPSDAPGHAPTTSYVDEGIEYSADGCWYKSDTGYWRPPKRCRVVRIP